MRHFQHLHGKLDGRARAVIFALGLVRRHEVGDVAQDEQLAVLRIEHCRNIDSGIATGDDHRGRRLAKLGKLKIAAALRRVAVAQKAPVSFDQVLRQSHCDPMLV